MPRHPVREIDVRYWVPALAVAVLVVATLVWMSIDYHSRRSAAESRALADWHRSMLRIQRLLESGAEGQSATVPAEALFTLFDDTPGLRYLAAVDASARILHANRQGLPGQTAAALPGFDPETVRAERLTGRADAIGLDADGHIRGYYPLLLTWPAAEERPSPDALLYLDFGTSQLVAPLRQQLLRQTGIFAAVIFTGLLTGVLFVQRYVNRPIATITRSVREFHPGHPLTTIPLTGRGPLNRLARAFERGARTLNDSIRETERRENRLARILESIGDAVIITDAEGRIERVNPTAESLTGWRREAALGRLVTEIFAPFSALDGRPLPNPVLEVLETHAPVRLANHAAIIAHDGHQYQIADTAAPIRAADGTIEGVVLVFHDVSEAYRLREEQRIAAVAFDTAAPQLVADRLGHVIRVNRACLELGGYSREEMLGFQLVGDIFIGQESPGLGEFLAGRAGFDTWSGPTWWRRKNGERVNIWVTDSIIRDAQGEISYFVISAIDTTELAKAASALAETQDNYQRLIESINDGIAIIQQQRFVDCNQRLAAFLGRAREQILGHTVAQLSLPRQLDDSDSGAKARALFDEVIARGEGRADWSMMRADGTPIILDATLSRIFWRGEPALLAVARDVTEHRQLEAERQRLLAALGRSEQMMRLASAAYGIAAWELDPENGTLTWAQDAESVLGVDHDRLPATHAEVLRLIHPADRKAFDAAMQNALAEMAVFRIEFRAIVPGREGRWFRSQGECRREDSGAMRLFGAIADISDYRKAQADIEQLAFHDPLTGLANRRLLLDRLQHAVRQTRRSGQWGAVLFVDLDRFKLLNDSLGHSAGDALLRQVGQRCGDAVRDADTLARLGGDEFVILATDLGDNSDAASSHAGRIANKLRERLNTAYPVGGHDYHLSASVGIALFPRDGDTAEELLRHADVAMYQTKQRGRDGVTFYQPSQLSHTNRRLEFERDLRKALELDQLLLHYQPKVDAGGEVIGAEALLRWQHPQHGMVPPLDFIPIAEESGLIYPIGKYVMRTACAHLARWRERAPQRALSLAVNVSPHQFRHADFVPCVTEAVRDFGVPADALIVEITESTMLDGIDLVIARMRDLKALGVAVSVDDFGTGYSSLYYLKNLPLDEIKIDQSYIRDLLEDANDTAIVESIIAIARNLKLRTVAEGVATAAQANTLRAMGCGVHQGYHYSRPLPLDEFEAFARL
jgi:diguanylate cyclase (GGDEF)-like protein/PAS domain S-box-containing protein